MYTDTINTTTPESSTDPGPAGKSRSPMGPVEVYRGAKDGIATGVAGGLLLLPGISLSLWHRRRTVGNRGRDRTGGGYRIGVLGSG